MKKTAHHLIAEVPHSSSKVEMTIGIDLGDVWSHYCTLNQDDEVVGRGRFRTTPAGVDKWFTDLPRIRVAMEAGTHSIWISEQLQELGHEVLVANVRELRAISHSDRKSDQVDAEKLARYARLDPKILRPISHRTVAQQEALTLIRARNLLVRLRTAAVNAVRGLAKPCGFMVPGMFHCGGGIGTSTFDAMTPLIQWVESNKAPTELAASRVVDGKVVRTRPVCAYPEVARYKGSGSLDEAANFSCTRP